MNIEKVKRYSLVELVLLGIFFIGLLISGLIVKLRSRVVLSQPLELPGAGLSVCMPEGDTWDRTPSWQYEESARCMALIGQFHSQSRSGIEVRWRYYFATPAGSEKELLEKYADSIGAKILHVDTVGEQEPMVYARMVSHTTVMEQFYVGLRRLDFDRSVELLVKSRRMNGLYEDSVFTSLAQSITYQRPEELANGREFLDTFIEHEAGLNTAAPFADETFLIQDVRRSAAGYYDAHQNFQTDQNELFHRIQFHHAVGNIFDLESDLWFNPSDRTYRWETAIQSLRVKNRHRYEVRYDPDGTLSVTGFENQTHYLEQTHFFLPEPLVTQAARVFVEGSFDSVVVDIISPEGQLVPVRLTKIDPGQSNRFFENVVSEVRVDYLHREDSYEELFFDASKQLLGKLEQAARGGVLIWIAADRQDLQDIFKLDVQEIFKGKSNVRTDV